MEARNKIKTDDDIRELASCIYFNAVASGDPAKFLELIELVSTIQDITAEDHRLLTSTYDHLKFPLPMRHLTDAIFRKFNELKKDAEVLNSKNKVSVAQHSFLAPPASTPPTDCKEEHTNNYSYFS